MGRFEVRGLSSFTARIKIIGVNPYVRVPDAVLRTLFKAAARSTGPLPVRGALNGQEYKQTVVKYQGMWRLYLNTQMRRSAGIDVGDLARLVIEFDPVPRIVPMHPTLGTALAKDKAARRAF